MKIKFMNEPQGERKMVNKMKATLYVEDDIKD